MRKNAQMINDPTLRGEPDRRPAPLRVHVPLQPHALVLREKTITFAPFPSRQLVKREIRANRTQVFGCICVKQGRWELSAAATDVAEISFRWSQR